MECPFQIGDRIRNITRCYTTDATVIELTDKGFKYKLDKKEFTGRPYFGWWYEGEVYEAGFQFWEKIN